MCPTYKTLSCRPPCIIRFRFKFDWLMEILIRNVESSLWSVHLWSWLKGEDYWQPSKCHRRLVRWWERKIGGTELGLRLFFGYGQNIRYQWNLKPFDNLRRLGKLIKGTILHLFALKWIGSLFVLQIFVLVLSWLYGLSGYYYNP